MGGAALFGRDGGPGGIAVVLFAVLAGKRAIDGTNMDINREIIELRNAASQPAQAKAGLGHFDLAALQKGADTYRALGMVQRQIKVTEVVDTSLLPGA